MDWGKFIEAHQAVVCEIRDTLRPTLETVVTELVRCIRDGGKILICGNGGSAADAQHFAAELVNRFQRERRPYAALALTTDSSILTSIGNDYDFTQIYSKQVEALARPGDVLIAISTSGNAANVCLAADAARTAGSCVVGMSGASGGKLAEKTDHMLCISSSRVTARIQEGHIMLIHAICEMLEEQLASEISQ